jgi:RNase P subunit RPR2
LLLIEADPRPLVRGLIHSDGSRHINTIRHPKKIYRYSRYEFTNLSTDIKRIFCSACDLLGIEWRVMNAKTISIAKRESVALMDEFVGPKR